MTKPPEQLGRLVDTPKKPQKTDEEEAAAPPVPAPSPPRPASSPFRPLSRRRRQAQLPEPPPGVERPSTSLVFDASPTTVAAALAKAGGSPEDASMAWRAGRDREVHVEREGQGDAGAARDAVVDTDV